MIKTLSEIFKQQSENYLTLSKADDKQYSQEINLWHSMLRKLFKNLRVEFNSISKKLQEYVITASKDYDETKQRITEINRKCDLENR